MIAKIFETYVLSMNNHVSEEKQLKLFFLKTIMSSKRRSSFSPKNMIAPWGNLSLPPLGTWLFREEQLKFFFFREFVYIHFVHE